MIVGETFVWFHLGKTGGKTSRSMISCIKNEKLKKIFDRKLHHMNRERYESHFEESLSDKFPVVGFRRLIPYMHSYYGQQHGHMNDFYESASKGFLKRRDSNLLLPDSMLKHYTTDCYKIEDVRFLRLELIEEDFIRVFENFDFNYNEIERLSRIKKGSRRYKMYDFSKKEIDYIYLQNPLWRSMELRLYGDLYGD